MVLDTLLGLFPGRIVVAAEPSRFVPRTCCWNWLGPVKFSPNGLKYGRVSYKGELWLVHRLSFVLSGRCTTEDDPFVCHTCDNSLCCNDEHLFKGNNSTNQLDRIKWLVGLGLEEIKKIRSSRLPESVLARQFKVPVNQIKLIRPRFRIRGGML